MLKKISLENFNATVCNMIMQGSSISVDSKLLKPNINHGPILGPQKGVQSLSRNSICYIIGCYNELLFR